MAGPLARILNFWSNTTTANQSGVDGALPVLKADELLHPHKDLVQSIRRIVGVPRAHWNELYQPMLEAYAEFVQQLPASEAHHHAGPGGMLAHGLESVNEALKLRRGQLLPRGATAEDLAKQQDLWTYAVATGALLHDLGKPVSDQKIRLYGRNGISLGQWNPWDGAMTDTASWYRVEFVRDRRYRLHERLPLLLIRTVLPQPGLSWLSSNLEVFDAWLAVISGDIENADPLGQVIQQADGISVSVNLAGIQSQMPAARQKPLSSRLLTGLRFLLDNQALPLNRKGAAGWLIDGDVWLVSKRTLDALREHLEQEGHGGVPRRNDRLMDEMQQSGLLVPNHDERAVWTATINIGDWSQKLTMLRAPAHIVWPNEDTRPEPCAGTVTLDPEEVPGTDSTERDESVIQPPAKSSETDDAADLAETPSSDSTSTLVARHTNDKSESTAEQPAPTTSIHLPLPPGINLPASGDGKEKENAREHSKSVVGVNPTGNDAPGPDAGEAFIQWLRDGLTSGRMLINTVNARIHVVPEGLLLVSPRIFKDFAPEKWSHAQKRFLKLKVHQKNPDGTNIWIYQTEGSKKRSKLKGIRIDDPETLLGFGLPEPNSHLSLYKPQNTEVKDSG